MQFHLKIQILIAPKIKTSCTYYFLQGLYHQKRFGTLLSKRQTTSLKQTCYQSKATIKTVLDTCLWHVTDHASSRHIRQRANENCARKHQQKVKDTCNILATLRKCGITIAQQNTRSQNSQITRYVNRNYAKLIELEETFSKLFRTYFQFNLFTKYHRPELEITKPLAERLRLLQQTIMKWFLRAFQKMKTIPSIKL